MPWSRLINAEGQSTWNSSSSGWIEWQTEAMLAETLHTWALTNAELAVVLTMNYISLDQI